MTLSVSSEARATKTVLGLDAAIIALAVLALRVMVLGNPHVHVDEEFYLLVGGRMLDGALPYIDIWDRKPVGLLLIYEFAAMFGDGVIAYQLLAMLFVFATSMIIYSVSRRYADRPTAVLAAITYVLLLNLLEGMGGQAPVFYNLLVTAAAAILMRLFTERSDISVPHLVGWGAAAMLLMGLAIQIKYSAVGEAALFGFFLLWLLWRRKGAVPAFSCGLIWAAAALAPTLLAYLYYYRLGAGDAFLYANFYSIAERGGDPTIWVVNRFISIMKVLALPILIGLGGWIAWARKSALAGAIDARHFVLFWNAAAWFSFLGFGTFFPHYALPLAAPAALLFAFASGRWLAFRALVVVGGAIVSLITVHREVGDGGGAPVIESTLAAMGHSRNCPYMYEGSPILYHLGHYCLPTRYPFPYHLSIVREHNALGIDADAELRRILSRNPDYIVARLPFSSEHRKESDMMVLRALKQRYRPVMATRQWRIYSVVLFRLRPEFTPLPNDARDFPPPPRR
jgi:hypothetical protein